MNRSISRLFSLVTVLFIVLVGFTSYWSVFDAGDLKANTANKRPLLEEQRVRRGDILADDGTRLATSERRGAHGSPVYVRRYPSGSLFSHAVGYNFVDRGRTGIERSHNADLVGEHSEFRSILDELRGHKQEGDDLQTSLDPKAQRVALAALQGRAGSVVALDPSTGRIQVMASTPGYDPNQADSNFSSLLRASGSPLLNRATQGGYPPGSTFKVVTAAAALDSGKFTPESALSGHSPITISGAPLQNFGGEQFGNIDLTTALTHSVNTVWAQVGEKLGKDTMYKYMQRFGFNSKPPLDYPAQQMLASGAYQGRRLLGPGDSIDIGRVAIGQERLRVTPLQMAMVAAAVANRGVLMKPRFWERLIDRDGRTVERLNPRVYNRVMSEQSAAQLTEMMKNVVREGTGTAAALEGISVAGKTGTAEVAPGVNQAWFIGFAPAEHPRVAVAATIERTPGQGGTVAAPIAKAVMKQLLGR